MVDVRISTSTTSLIILRLESFIVSGTALVDPQITSNTAANSINTPQLVKFTGEGEIIEAVALTEEEYFKYLYESVYVVN